MTPSTGNVTAGVKLQSGACLLIAEKKDDEVGQSKRHPKISASRFGEDQQSSRLVVVTAAEP